MLGHQRLNGGQPARIGSLKINKTGGLRATHPPLISKVQVSRLTPTARKPLSATIKNNKLALKTKISPAVGSALRPQPLPKLQYPRLEALKIKTLNDKKKAIQTKASSSGARLSELRRLQPRKTKLSSNLRGELQSKLQTPSLTALKARKLPNTTPQLRAIKPGARLSELRRLQPRKTKLSSNLRGELQSKLRTPCLTALKARKLPNTTPQLRAIKPGATLSTKLSHNFNLNRKKMRSLPGTRLTRGTKVERKLTGSVRREGRFNDNTPQSRTKNNDLSNNYSLLQQELKSRTEQKAKEKSTSHKKYFAEIHRITATPANNSNSNINNTKSSDITDSKPANIISSNETLNSQEHLDNIHSLEMNINNSTTPNMHHHKIIRSPPCRSSGSMMKLKSVSSPQKVEASQQRKVGVHGYGIVMKELSLKVPPKLPTGIRSASGGPIKAQQASPPPSPPPTLNCKNLRRMSLQQVVEMQASRLDFKSAFDSVLYELMKDSVYKAASDIVVGGFDDDNDNNLSISQDVRDRFSAVLHDLRRRSSAPTTNIVRPTRSNSDCAGDNDNTSQVEGAREWYANFGSVLKELATKLPSHDILWDIEMGTPQIAYNDEKFKRNLHYILVGKLPPKPSTTTTPIVFLSSKMPLYKFQSRQVFSELEQKFTDGTWEARDENIPNENSGNIPLVDDDNDDKCHEEEEKYDFDDQPPVFHATCEYSPMLETSSTKLMKDKVVQEFRALKQQNEFHKQSSVLCHVVKEIAAKAKQDEIRRSVIQELKDRSDCVEIQGFKQLVIMELGERCDAMKHFKARILSELVRKCLALEIEKHYNAFTNKANKAANVLNEVKEKIEWVDVHKKAPITSWVEIQDRTEWVVCNDDDDDDDSMTNNNNDNDYEEVVEDDDGEGVEEEVVVFVDDDIEWNVDESFELVDY